MNSDTLSKHKFLLFISEPWTQYETVTVEFVDTKLIEKQPYHRFKDGKGVVYGLTPRLPDQKLEDVLSLNRIIVDILIFRNAKQTEKLRAIGGLQLIVKEKN